jgi:hypothetical protein
VHDGHARKPDGRESSGAQRGEQLAAHREREVGRAQRTRRQAPAAGQTRADQAVESGTAHAATTDGGA